MNSTLENSLTASVAPLITSKFSVGTEKDVLKDNINTLGQQTIGNLSTPPSASEIDDALDVVNKAVVFEQRSLSFRVDETSGKSIIKVMDKNTDELIRQIPSEELLKVAQDIKRLQNEMGQSLGLLIDSRI